jgi:ubiquinone/menaquinone biosynthesis C-methylase UbiE
MKLNSATWIFLSAALFQLTGLSASAQSPRSTPAQAPSYMGRQIARTMHWQGAAWLVRQKREREEAALEMRANLGLKPGMVVCDMGSGNGYHSLPIAKAVGASGKVFAVDLQPEMIEMLRERCQKAGVTNIEAIVGQQKDACLPAASCDLILLVDVYHEFAKPAEMLRSMRQALKPGGLVALVEFRAEDPEVPIRPEHKMSRAQILRELEANGFALSQEYKALPWQHLMFFKVAANL